MNNGQEIKKEFLKRWNIDNVRSMTLEQYTNLGRDDSFTYWIESKTTDVLSIWGGSGYKFGIFKRNPDAEQKILKSGQSSDNEYGWYSKYGNERNEVFNKVKQLIIKTIESAQIKKFENIDDIDLGNAFKWKIAYMYAPEGTLLRIALDKAFLYLAKLNGIKSKKISEIQMSLIEKKPHDEDFLTYSSRLWDEFTEQTMEDNSEKNKYEEIEEQNFMLNDKINPLNQILYGPPGTGKTYHTINKAIEIIDNNFYQKHKEPTTENRTALKNKFDELKESGQIVFTTFHQSFGYEEFVEGIKAISPDDERNTTGELTYKIEDGIFKKLSKLAEVNAYYSQSNFKSAIEQYSLDYPLIGIHASMIKDNENAYRVLEGSRIRKDTTPSFNNNNVRDTFIQKAKYTDQDEYFVLTEDYTFKSISGAASIVVGAAANGNIAWKLVPNENKIEKLEIPQNNYILIIDEINRGNISKIFGELITLIEDSKRIGKPEEIRVKLPYSGDDFGVPSNLYIIGTMNTADRSIALMDTALRRRFEFIEMMPDLSVVEKIENVDGINIKSLLETINKRVEYLYDRDHTIGHAYFMGLKDPKITDKKAELDNIFRNKIIPLLQEYFYDDWEKIQIVLGDHSEQFKAKNFNTNFKEFQFIQDTKLNEKIVLGFNHPDIENDSIEYIVNTDFAKEAYIKVYGNYPQVTNDENAEQATSVN